MVSFFQRSVEMMKKKLPVGIENFKDFVTEDF